MASEWAWAPGELVLTTVFSDRPFKSPVSEKEWLGRLLFRLRDLVMSESEKEVQDLVDRYLPGLFLGQAKQNNLAGTLLEFDQILDRLSLACREGPWPRQPSPDQLVDPKNPSVLSLEAWLAELGLA